MMPPFPYTIGVYVYGALALAMLFVANLTAGNVAGVVAVIVSAGAAYISANMGVLGRFTACDVFAAVSVFTAGASLGFYIW